MSLFGPFWPALMSLNFLIFVNIRVAALWWLHTYTRKEYLYSAYYPNSKSLYALRSLNKKVFSCRLKVANDSPGCRKPGGRSFQTREPAAEKLMSPNLLWVHGTSNVRMSLELDRSGRRPASDNRRQSSMRYAGATPSSDWVSMFIFV